YYHCTTEFQSQRASGVCKALIEEAIRMTKGTSRTTEKATQVEAIWPGLEAGVPKPLMPYSPAVRAGDWIFVSGQLASDFKTGLAPGIRHANTDLEGDLYLQSGFVLRNLVNTMREAGCDPARDMVRIWQWFQSEKPTREDMARGNL